MNGLVQTGLRSPAAFRGGRHRWHCGWPRGLTDEKVAARLFISRRTVDTHVRHINRGAVDGLSQSLDEGLIIWNGHSGRQPHLHPAVTAGCCFLDAVATAARVTAGV